MGKTTSQNTGSASERRGWDILIGDHKYSAIQMPRIEEMYTTVSGQGRSRKRGQSIVKNSLRTSLKLRFCI